VIEDQFKPLEGFYILRERIMAMKDRQSIEEVQHYLPQYQNVEQYSQLLGKIDALVKEETAKIVSMTVA
jgi:hypothetical protein